MQQTFHPQHTKPTSIVYTHNKPFQKLSIPTKIKINVCLCVDATQSRMLSVVLNDEQDTFPSDEDILLDNANLDALTQSVTSFVDTQILCFGLIYVLLGCMIAYIDCKRLKRWQWRVRRSMSV